MNILSYNPGHDGSVVYIKDGRLMYSIEAEKDSNYRYSAISIDHFLDAIGELDVVPEVICRSGWWAQDHHEFLHGSNKNAGYRGLSNQSSILDKGKFFRGRTDFFSSSHERSHILSAFGMSNLQLGTKCYALVWEGEIGAFYEIDPSLNITLIGNVLNQPGNRYGFLYGLADPTFPKDGPYPRDSDAGKLMALASFSTRKIPTEEENHLLGFLLDGPLKKLSEYDRILTAPHLNVGLDDLEFRNFAGIYSDAIFDRFHEFAKAKLEIGRPLLIAGGCGLNCDWNTKWKETGFFSEIFVPPVANDSGSAIGTAIDAQFRSSGNPKIHWDVYSGLNFRMDAPVDQARYDIYDKNDDRVADMLANDIILGWAHGKYEIGPRALGNRSILAAPFLNDTCVRLNKIKQRENFRPIAPVCLREDADKWFGCDCDSPYMLYTYQVKTEQLKAVTHVNGTARLQTVSSDSNLDLYNLLDAFKKRTGYGVLCNTSLNFNGKGFINSFSDICVYTEEYGLDGFVVDGRAYLLKKSPQYKAYLTGSNFNFVDEK